MSAEISKGLKKQAAVIFAVFLTALYISAYRYQLMLIQGDSMYPSFRSGQLVFLNKHDKDYYTGDVIAFYCSGLDAVLVKRIVGAPGDTVEITGGRLFVNGTAGSFFSEDEYISYAGIADRKITLKEGEYFVMGDNHEVSRDSRYEEVGIVFREDIIGKVCCFIMQR